MGLVGGGKRSQPLVTLKMPGTLKTLFIPDTLHTRPSQSLVKAAQHKPPRVIGSVLAGMSTCDEHMPDKRPLCPQTEAYSHRTNAGDYLTMLWSPSCGLGPSA